MVKVDRGRHLGFARHRPLQAALATYPQRSAGRKEYVDQVLEDPDLGKLTWEEDLQWWRGEMDWASGHPISVAVSCVEKEEIQILLPQARRAFAWVREHEAHARLCAARELLDLYNSTWREKEEPISLQEFARRIKLVEIGIRSEGATELWYDDGDLFAGHQIAVKFDPEGKFQRADIHG
jgi:hypothetical protein